MRLLAECPLLDALLKELLLRLPNELRDLLEVPEEKLLDRSERVRERLRALGLLLCALLNEPSVDARPRLGDRPRLLPLLRCELFEPFELLR